MKLLSFLGKLQFNLHKVWLHPSVSWFVSVFAFEIGSDFGTVTRNKFLYICNCAFAFGFMQLFQPLVCKCLLEVLRAVHKGILGFWCKTTLSVIIEFAICIYCTGHVLFLLYIFEAPPLFSSRSGCAAAVVLRHWSSGAKQGSLSSTARITSSQAPSVPLTSPTAFLDAPASPPPTPLSWLVGQWHFLTLLALNILCCSRICCQLFCVRVRVGPWALQSHNLLNNYHMMERSVPMSPVRPF